MIRINFDKLQPVFLKIWEENPSAHEELAVMDSKQYERGKIEKDGNTFVQLTEDEAKRLKDLYESII